MTLGTQGALEKFSTGVLMLFWGGLKFNKLSFLGGAQNWSHLGGGD